MGGTGAVTMTADWITEAQRQLPPHPVVPRLRAHYRRIARWWELEAMRDYIGVIDEDGKNSSDRSRQYARNYRWLVELMDAGHRVTADAHGVYIDGELASVVQARGERAERRKQERHAVAAKEAARPERTRRSRGAR